MDKARLHRQFARPLSKLFETAIFRGNTLAVSFLFCWLFGEARWPASRIADNVFNAAPTNDVSC